MAKEEQYFGAQPADEIGAILHRKINAWTNSLEANGYLEKIRMMWAAYHGAYYTDAGYGHQISFTGEQGELTALPINQFRNFSQHILVITTSNRPSMEARATNTDYKSLVQTKLATGLLDYYMREKRLERFLKRAVEYAIVMGAGFIKLSWNQTTGSQYDYNEETDTPIYEGDVEFQNLSPFDVIYDGTKESQDHDWVICRTYKNKWDLIAKYPELAEKIKNIPTKDEEYKYYNFAAMTSYKETDDISVYEFFHRRTESMPKGRYMLSLAPDVTLVDAPMPYRELPVFRIAPSDILGTPYGYSPMFDILPIQEALNMLYSTIASNQSAFGVQSIYVPRGADVQITQLAGGLNIIEGNEAMGKPEPLQLTNTPPEIFKFLELLERTAETLSGVNSVARGNPEKNLESGAALALVQAQALQFLSGLQQSYVQMIEDVGTALINMLKDFATVPRIAAIAGKSNRAYMKEFKGDDLSQVNRVIVDMGNPLARTTAGRVQMAEQMLQMGIIKNPNDYITVMNTGKLEAVTDGAQAELLLIKGENEKMVAGESVPVLAIDEHTTHIFEHKAVLADPDLRANPELTKLVLDHIQEHITALRETDPDLLGLINQPSLQKQQQMSPQQPQGAPPSAPSQQPGVGASSPSLPQGPMAPPPGMNMPIGPDGGLAQLPEMPSIPTPPPPFETLPTNPQNMPMS